MNRKWILATAHLLLLAGCASGNSTSSSTGGSGSTGTGTGTGGSGSSGTGSTGTTSSPEYLYVTTTSNVSNPNQEIGTVYAYSVNSTTGALTLIGPAIQTTDAQPHVFINSIGNFMYIDSVWSNKVYAYAPNSATGALTPISGSPYQLGVPIGPNGQGDLGGEMSLDGTGKFLRFYNVNGATPGTSLSNTNTVFQIDPTTGALSHQTYFTNVTNYEGPVVVDPTGAYAYTGNTTGALYLQTGLLSNYTVNASNGVITLNNITPQSGFESTGGLEPLVIMHPSGKFMYVFNETSQSVDTNFDIFTINGANGTVTPSGLGLYDAGGSISSFQVEPKGRFAYIVINQKTQVCTIDPTTGILTKVGTPAATTADGVTGAFFARGAYTFDPTGSFAWATTYTATGTPQLSAFSINSTTGALTSITTYPFPTSTGILAGMNLASF